MPLRDEREIETVIHDRWDFEDYAHVREEVEALPTATDALGEITKTARPEMADVFFLFNKAAPDLHSRRSIRDDHVIDLAVNEALRDLPEYREIRRYTRGDIVASAMAAVRIEPTLETLFDREKQKQEQADKLQKLREELLQKLSEMSTKQLQEMGKPGGGQDEGQEPGEGQGSAQGQSEEDLQAQIDALQKAIDALEKQLQDDLEGVQASMQAALQGPMREAVDEARDESQTAHAWGVEPGRLVRLPADVRLKMAAKLNQPRLREIARLFGPMHNLAIAQKVRRVPDIPHEYTGVTMGRDLERLLPAEIVKMRDPRQKRQWMVDYAEGKLLQYKTFGTEKVGKGGIILCEDGSGSMSGQRELMAKAVMLCLLNIAKVQGREFHLIHFGSAGLIKHLPFRSPSEYSMENVIEAAELHFASGTDFTTPLKEAVKLLKDENARTGRVKSDIVFLTDGQCGVPDAFKTEFLETMERLDAVMWGVIIDGRKKSEPLYSLCSGKVCTVDDLTNAGKEMKEIFKAL